MSRQVHGEVVLEGSGLTKSFGNVRALSDASLEVRAGEVHALVGANGAGKSTLIKIFAGAQFPDRGEIRINGEAIKLSHPDAARDAGLSFIHQDLMLVPQFSAAENMYVGRHYPRTRGLISRRGMRESVRPVADELGIDFPLDIPVGELSLAHQWQVAICRSMVTGARVIFMDEPTAALSVRETDRMFEQILAIRRSGRSVVFVSHRIEEVLYIADRVTVLRNGMVASSARDAAEFDHGSLLALVAGRAVAADSQGSQMAAAQAVASATPAVAPALRVRNLRGTQMPRDVSFDVYRGEVLGIAGLVGSGRSETLRAVFGADAIGHGSTMQIDGESYRPTSPAEAMRHGVALLPEDRKTEGLVMGFSIGENATLANLRDIRRWKRWPIISHRKERELGSEMILDLGIKAEGPTQSVSLLSGGNQQKVALGKWLRLNPRIVLLDEPTKGVDMGGKAEIHDLILRLARKGAAVVVVSSEFEELVSLADRHVVVRDGTSVADIKGATTVERLIEACVGVDND